MKLFFGTNLIMNQVLCRVAYLLLVVLFATPMSVIGQANGVGVGQWRDYLPYREAKWIVHTPTKVFAATPQSLFSYSLEDKSIERLNSITGLSDVGISAVKYHESSDNLIVGYSNGNIDLVRDDRIINFGDILRSDQVSPRTINSILIVRDEVYLSCGFGIVWLHLEKNDQEVRETFFIGNLGAQIDVLDLAFDGQYFYASSNDGIYKAAIDGPALSIPSSWTKFPQLPYSTIPYYHEIDYFNGKIYANYRSILFNNDSTIVYDPDLDQWSPFLRFEGLNTHSMEVYNDKLLVTHSNFTRIYNVDFQEERVIFTYNSDTPPTPKHAIIDPEGNWWMADNNQGMIRVIDEFKSEVIVPNGPFRANVSSTMVSDGDLWIAAGSIESQKNSNFFPAEAYRRQDGEWELISQLSDTVLNPIHDIVTLAVHPNDPDLVYGASFGAGLVEFRNGKVFNIYNSTNSALEEIAPLDPDFNWVGVRGLDFDDDGNLWMSVNKVNKVIAVLTNGGKWIAYEFPGVINTDLFGQIIVSQLGHKWVVMPRGGLLVFDDNGTPSNFSDDQARVLNAAAGAGNLPSPTTFCVAEDKDGEIWVGTDLGVAVFYSPGDVFSGGAIDAQQIFVQQDGQTKILLETETVSSIAVDGADRKWFATEKAGVFLMSPDGTEEIHHFTTENSPLLSNNVLDITIDPDNGEVIFATDKGVIAYRGTATEGGIQCNDVYAFPNPVPNDYSGTIAISGLIRNSNVKITDVDGNLVYETVSDGGQAIWDGRSLSGDKVSTGVYLVFCSDPQGQNTCVSKILFVN